MPKRNHGSAAPAATRGKPRERLVQLIDEAVALARTAKRHRQSLNGANFYANKLADLRADATNAFSSLSNKSVGDTSAIAELMQKVFSVDAKSKDRTQAARDLQFDLRTRWENGTVDHGSLEEGGVFPLVTLNQTNRGYMVAIGRQMNGCYTAGWHDACAVMMRRLLETAIIEAYEAHKIDAKVKDRNGDFFQLTALINAALAEPSWNLSRGVKKELPKLCDLGHKSAHGRHYLAKELYIDELKTAFRDSLDAFLHQARLI